jgi:integrase/recombinase XerD
MDHDIHNYERRIAGETRLIKESTSIPETNKKAIFRFKDDSLAEGITKGRIARYLWDLKTLSQWLDMEFEKATKKDIKSLLGKLETSKYSYSTKRDLKITLRKFYKWLRGTETIPEEVSWFKTNLKSNNRKLPEEVLTQEEVAKMIRVAGNTRDRAFISTFYESGCRIGEILTLKLKHVVPANPGIQLTVDGKTGARRIRIIASAVYLNQWINIHPYNENPEAYLWVSRNGEIIGYRTVTQLLAKLKQKAGIKKRIYPHIFRHSRATHLANHLTEAQMKQYFGWIQASKMASVYVHLSGRDVDDAILKCYGIVKQDQQMQNDPLKPKTCDRCHKINPATNEYCDRCGMPLTKKAVMELMQRDLAIRTADNLLDQLIGDPEFRQMFGEKINALLKKNSD